MAYFKVVNDKTGSPLYFNDKTDSVFISPLEQVKRFLKRNTDKSYTVYIETSKPKPFPRWELFRYSF